jgi:hypothetical protein
VNQADDDGATPLFAACGKKRQLSTVQLLSSYGASRTFVVSGTQMAAEALAALFGPNELHAWLVRSRQ